MGSVASEEKIRVDKWLWAARFFKTRSTAAKAVAGGHIQLNGRRVKPARTVQVGDTLHIRRGNAEFEIVVVELSTRRGPAVKARTLYEETPGSLERREAAARERKLQKWSESSPAKKPDKRDRRKIRKFLRKD